MRDPDDVINSGMFAGFILGIIIFMLGFIVAQASNGKMTIEQCLKSTAILQSKERDK